MEGTPEQQLKSLEEEYQRRRAEIESGPKPEQPESTHETMSRVTEEKIQQHVPAFQAPTHQPAPAASSALSDEDQTKVQSWVNDVFSKGLDAAIKEARDADPALLDAFHAALTGQLHDQLVAQKKLTEVN